MFTLLLQLKKNNKYRLATSYYFHKSGGIGNKFIIIEIWDSSISLACGLICNYMLVCRCVSMYVCVYNVVVVNGVCIAAARPTIARVTRETTHLSV